LVAGRFQKGIVSNIQLEGLHNIYISSRTKVFFGNLLGVLSDNGSLNDSYIQGTINAQIKSKGTTSDNMPRIGGFIGSSGGSRHILANTINATLNYDFELAQTNSRYDTGYFFGGISGNENGGEYSYNLVSGVINLTDNTSLANQTISIGGILGRNGNKQAYNMFDAVLSIQTPGYVNFGGFTGSGSLSQIRNFIFAGTVTISAYSKQYIGYIVPDVDNSSRVHNENYLLSGSSILGKAIDTLITPIIESSQSLPNSFKFMQFNLINSSDNTLIVMSLSPIEINEIIQSIEMINGLSEFSSESDIALALDKFNELSSFQASFVVNKDVLNNLS
jgi:hypothetical protein